MFLFMISTVVEWKLFCQLINESNHSPPFPAANILPPTNSSQSSNELLSESFPRGKKMESLKWASQTWSLSGYVIHWWYQHRTIVIFKAASSLSSSKGFSHPKDNKKWREGEGSENLKKMFPRRRFRCVITSREIQLMAKATSRISPTLSIHRAVSFALLSSIFDF